MRSSFLLCCWFLCALPATSAAQASLSDAELASIADAVREEMASLRAPGVSLAIVRDGAVAWAGGFGLANVERSTPATEQTLYRTASLAKPITATAVMQLVESGVIDLDADIREYCPAFPEKRWPVSARQLLAHTGGTRHPTDSEDEQTQQYDSVGDALGVFASDRLLHQPGTRTSYSTFGYMLLACAIEGASGRSYLDWLQDRIFTVAAMTMTSADTVPLDDAHRAAGYRLRGRQLGPSLRVNTSFKLAAGGLVSNVVDMARFVQAVLDDRLVSEATRTLMWSPAKLNDGSETPFGLGWQISGSKARAIIIANGQQEEVSTFLAIFPERRAAIVLMSNLERHVPQFVPLVNRIRSAIGLD